MGSEDKTPAGDAEALKSRLDTLAKALDAKRQESDVAERARAAKQDAGIGKAMGTGFRVASELAAAIIVGGLLGWQLDRWTGREPVFLLIFLIMGIIAGFWNVYRLAAQPKGAEQDADKRI